MGFSFTGFHSTGISLLELYVFHAQHVVYLCSLPDSHSRRQVSWYHSWHAVLLRFVCLIDVPRLPINAAQAGREC
jgi:hypothetical protein